MDSPLQRTTIDNHFMLSFSQSVVFDSFVTPWTVAVQAPLSMGFSRQEYWSGLSFLSLGDLPDPAIKPQTPALQAESLPSESPGKPRNCIHICIYMYGTKYAKYFSTYPDQTN